MNSYIQVLKQKLDSYPSSLEDMTFKQQIEFDAILLCFSVAKNYIPIEKEQIINAREDGHENTVFEKDGDGYKSLEIDSEDYYKNTYKN